MESSSRQPTAKKITIIIYLMKPVLSPFGPKMCSKKPPTPLALHRPEQPQQHENRRHGEGHVQVGVAAAQQRARHLKAVRRGHAPANRADARNQAEPVGEEDEDENGREKPKGLLHQIRARECLPENRKGFPPAIPRNSARRRELLSCSAWPAGRTG